MKSLVVALMALPFMAGAAGAAQPLSDAQMDGVTAGFFANGIADAEGLAGESGIVFTNAVTVSQVSVMNLATSGMINGAPPEFASLLYKSVSGAQSSTVLGTVTVSAIPGLGG